MFVTLWGANVLIARLAKGHEFHDAVLARLARKRGGRLATLDRRLGDLHWDIAIMIPS